MIGRAIFGVVVGFLLAGPACAQATKPTKDVVDKSARQKAFDRLDRSGDAKLDVDEFLDGSVGKASESKRAEFESWDLNNDGSLDFTEFKKRGNQQPTDEQRKQDFARRDQDKDGQVTYEEFLGERVGEQRTDARSAFFRFDTDENGTISESEFLNRAIKKLSAGNQFRQLDVDDDKKLSEDEFMRTKRGTQWEQAGRDNFRKFDLDRDDHLNEREFAMTPALKPDPTTLFHGLDVDRDGELNVDELVVLLPKPQADTARRSFAEYDTNDSGGLSLDEYLDRQSSLAWKKTKRSLANWGNTWGIALLILVDIGLAALIGRVIYRKFWGQATAKPGASSAVAVNSSPK